MWYDSFSYDIPKDFYFNPDVEYGTLTDTRDGHTYKTVVIGKLEWMAENLNYYSQKNSNLLEKSSCILKEKYCELAGRAYSWTAAMDISSTYESKLSGISEPHQGICPEGWHIPSGTEWEDMYARAGSDPLAIKSRMGWPQTTTDVSGFSAVSYGARWGSFEGSGSQTLFWSSTEYSKDEAYQWYIGSGENEKADLGHNSKEYGFYVRCVRAAQ